MIVALTLARIPWLIGVLVLRVISGLLAYFDHEVGGEPRRGGQ